MTEMDKKKTQGMDVESTEGGTAEIKADGVMPLITDQPEKAKPYEFRKLGTKDVFLMFSIISKIGINEFKTIFENGGIVDVVKGLTLEERETEAGSISVVAVIALDVVNVIFGNIGKCEKEIYQLLSQTSNLSVEEITADGNAVMFLEMLIDFFKKDEFPAFFKVVSSLFNK